VSTQDGGWEERIWTSDLRFMRRGPQLIELPLGDSINFFFFFFDMSTQEREEEEGIRTSDLRFIRRDPHLIELPFNDSIN
jgi:hypothetical protein